MAALWRAVTRRKSPDLLMQTNGESKSPLARVLSALDLTALGVGSTLGVGVYVLAGAVARDLAGPAVVISFAVAAVASVFAGLCYAEFGARVPLAGSAYIYSYVSIGEFVAFVIGWNLIMEYVIGCASVARGLSNYLDQLMGNVMEHSFQRAMPIHVDFLSPYFDFFAFAVSFALSVVLAFGVKESMAMNNLFTLVNLSIVLFVIIAGSFKADISNWQKDRDDIPEGYRGGKGGFFPFGVIGVLKGAATCFYGFVGFDCIATTGEEVRNPQRAIPLAIIVSLLIIFLSYFGVSAVLTLMWPYYMQDADAPLSYVFEQIGWPVAQWIVAIGGICGLFASLFGAMYPLPRVIYAMANDGLVFRFLGEVHPRFKTPLVGTLIAGLLTGLMAALFKLPQLVNMLSIGTLMAYTIVAACVLILRYQIHDSDSDTGASEYKETTNLVTLADRPTASMLFNQMFNWQGFKSPTATSCCLVNIEVAVYCLLSLALGLCLAHMEYGLEYGHWGPLTLVSLLSTLLLLVLLSIALQPSSNRLLTFKVPLVPAIPAVSITLNIYLMLMLDLHTWIRFAIWMAVGVVVYFITVPCRKLNFCCSERSPSPQRTEQDTHGALATTKTSGAVTNGINLDIEASEQKLNSIAFEGVPMISDNVKFNSNNFEESVHLKAERTSPVQIKISYATPLPSRRSSAGDIVSEPEMKAVASEMNEFKAMDSESTQVYVTEGSVANSTSIHEDQMGSTQEKNDSGHVSDEVTVDSDPDIPESERMIIQANNESILFPLDVENKSEYLDQSNEKGSIRNEYRGGLVYLIGHTDSTMTDQIAQENEETPTKSTTFTGEFSDGESGCADEDRDNESEADVRSLYPNVVVISSSEEDVRSRRTSTSSSVHSSGNITASDSPTSDPPDVNSTVLASSRQDLSSPVDDSSVGAENEHMSSTYPIENADSLSSPSEIASLDSYEAPHEHTSSTVSVQNTDSQSNPLKNSNLVEKLEKIIQEQARRVVQKSQSFSNSFRKTQSLSDKADSTQQARESKLNRPASSVAFNISGNTSSVTSSEPENLVLQEFNEGLDQMDDQEGNVFIDAADTEAISPDALENIRIKLERIFSSGNNPQLSSLQVKSVKEGKEGDKTASREQSEENVKSSACVENEESDDSAKMFEETRRKMANVLGTIRLRNKTKAMHIEDYFDAKDD